MSVLYWAPRILGMLFAGLISLFALDMFSEGYGYWGTLFALAMHLIPTALIVIVLIIAWRWEWAGALGFLGLGIGYLWLAWGKGHWTAYVVISGPMFLLAILFLTNWLWRDKLKPNRTWLNRPKSG